MFSYAKKRARSETQNYLVKQIKYQKFCFIIISSNNKPAIGHRGGFLVIVIL